MDSEASQRLRTRIARAGKLSLAMPVAFLFNLSIGLVNFAALFYLKKRFGATTATIGLFNAVWNGAYLAGCILLRPILGRFRPRLAVTVAPLFVAVLVALVLLSPSLLLDFLFYGVAGFAVALFWPPLMGWLTTGLEGQRLASMTTWYNLSWSLANIGSSVIAGLLVESAVTLPFYVAMLLMATVAALTIVSLRLVPDGRRGHLTLLRTVESPAPVVAGGHSTLRAGTPYRFPAWVGLLTAYFFLGVLLSVFPLYAHYRLGISEGLIGLVLVGRSLSMTIAFGVYSRFTFWHFKALPMALSQLLLAAVCMVMPMGRTPLFFLLLLPFAGMALSLAYNSSLFHAVSGVADRSARVAFNEAILTAGMVLGSSLGGAVYQYLSIGALFHGYALLLVAVAAYQIWFGFRLRLSPDISPAAPRPVTPRASGQ